MDRNLVYFIRKHLPESKWLHKTLAKIKLHELDKKLLPTRDQEIGERDPGSIPKIIDKYKERRKPQIDMLVKSFNAYLEKIEDDKLSPVMRDVNQMLFNCMAYGFAPDEYTYYRIAEMSLDEKREYINDDYRYRLQYIMSDFKDLQYCFDKGATYERLGKYYKRKMVSVSRKSDYEAFAQMAMENDVLVVKLVSASCGKGVKLLEVDKSNLQNQFDSILSQGRSIVEEHIVQSKLMQVFNTTTVNTVRVTSFRTNKGIVIGPCFVKTGRFGEFVDNAGSGGIIASVNRNTGIVETEGCDEYLNRYERHPDSGVQYRGFQLPEWQRCISLIKEMCNEIPRVGYTGWDVAHTEQGWVLVEANAAGQFVTQICDKKGLKGEIDQYVADRYFR